MVDGRETTVPSSFVCKFCVPCEMESVMSLAGIVVLGPPFNTGHSEILILCGNINVKYRDSSNKTSNIRHSDWNSDALQTEQAECL